MKADVELRFVVQSSPLDYGAFLIGFLPDGSQQYRYEIQNARPLLFSLSNGGSFSKIYPYINSYTGYDLQRYYVVSSFQQELPQWYYMPGPMQTLSPAMSSKVHVFGRFVNVKLWGSTYAEAKMQMNPASTPSTTATAAAVVGSVATAGLYSMAEGVKRQFQSTMSNKGQELFKNIVERKPVDHQDDVEEQAEDDTTPNRPTLYPGMSDITYNPTESLNIFSTRVIPKHVGQDGTVSFHEIARTPCLVFYETIAKDEARTLLLSPYDSSLLLPDYLSQVTNLFRFWRGSMKFVLQFHTSPLITAQFTIEMVNQAAYRTDPTVSTYDYLYRKVVEVTGFTEVPIICPYLVNTEWLPVGSVPVSSETERYYPASGRLTVTCNDISSGLAGSAAAPTVVLTVLRSAGDDFQFKNYVGTLRYSAPIPPEAKKEAVMQMDISCTSWPYSNIADQNGLSSFPKLRQLEEDNLTVSNMMGRWSNRGLINDEQYPLKSIFWREPGASDSVPDSFDFLLSWFAYCRGNIRVRSDLPNNVGVVYATLPGNRYHLAGIEVNYDYVGQSSAYTISEINNVLDFEVPIEGYTDWLSVDLNQHQGLFPYRYVHGSEEPIVATEWVKAGRGFQMTYLMPPLRFSILNTGR